MQMIFALGPADDTVVGLALKWVDDNPTHQQAHQVLVPLAAGPADDKVGAVLARWLDSTRSGIGYGAVLTALKQHPRRWRALKESGD